MIDADGVSHTGVLEIRLQARLKGGVGEVWLQAWGGKGQLALGCQAAKWIFSSKKSSSLVFFMDPIKFCLHRPWFATLSSAFGSCLY